MRSFFHVVRFFTVFAMSVQEYKMSADRQQIFKGKNLIFRHQFFKFIQIKIRVFQFSGKLIADLKLILQIKMMIIFQIESDIQFMDEKRTDNSHFDFGENFIIVNSTTEVCVDPIYQKLLFLNLPVRVMKFEFFFDSLVSGVRDSI